MPHSIPPITLDLYALRDLLRGQGTRQRGFIIQLSKGITPSQIIDEALQAESLSREME